MAAFAAMLAALIVAPVAANAASYHAAQKKPHVLFLISEDPDNYEAHKTIPPFAESLQRTQNVRVTVLKGEGELTAFRFPGLMEALADTDLIVFYSRRIALPQEQLNAIKNHIKSGKPLVGLRTANHGFAPRGKIADGHAAWPEFVSDILGCENTGYGAIKDGIKISTVPAAAKNPILKGLPEKWFSPTNIYKNKMLDSNSTVLLEGEAAGKVEPLAWTRMVGKSRIFYTSLGHPLDFDIPHYRTLVTNGILWALDAKAK
ncbi:MAG: hypothetical protein RIQ93_2672 [Verrucomicrobiota bacterium]